MSRKPYANKCTLENLKEFYFYNPLTGYFHRQPRLNIVGAVGNHGYYTLTIDGKSYLQHRLAWFYMTGEWPSEIDHIDRDKTNNKWENLREVTRTENSLNHPVRSDNTSGVPGVTFHSGTGKWRVRIANRHIGLFITKVEAIEAAASFRQLLSLKGT